MGATVDITLLINFFYCLLTFVSLIACPSQDEALRVVHEPVGDLYGRSDGVEHPSPVSEGQLCGQKVRLLTVAAVPYLLLKERNQSLKNLRLAEDIVEKSSINDALGCCSLFTPGFLFHYPYRFSIHLRASVSLTFPRYRWVVERLACLRITLLTISMGVPALAA